MASCTFADAEMSASTPLIFISYRRVDSGPFVRALADPLRQAFGTKSVFVDHDALQTGDEWPIRIKNAVEAAALCLVVIGPGWMRSADEFSRRRIDLDTDWVRQEIELAIAKGLRLIPLLVGGAALPPREGLPAGVRPLLDHQAYEVRDGYWEQDVAMLLVRLEDLGCRRTATKVQYPKPHVWPKELSEAELNEALESLSHWSLVVSPLPGQEPKTRTELVRTFQFKTFEDVLEFMVRAAPYIADMNHHPRWENIYASLVVALTTWDIGFRPSRFDIELAVFLDGLFRSFYPEHG
jgi:pterin-4a-carbinolamine dehydratase